MTKNVTRASIQKTLTIELTAEEVRSAIAKKAGCKADTFGLDINTDGSAVVTYDVEKVKGE